MKLKYSRYKHNVLTEVEKKLSKEDREVLDKFLKKCSITAGEKKVLHIKKLILQLTDITQKPLTKQTKESVNSFLVLLNQSDRSYWTKDELKIYIKQFLLWYYKDYEMVENFRSESKKGLNPQKITENLLITEEEVEKMLRSAQNYKEKAYLFLTFESGARPQEILNLRWKDIKFEDKYADITLYSGKTGQSRTFPLNKAKEHLWNWKQNYQFSDIQPKDLVFPSRWRERPLTTAGANKILRRMAVSSGLKKDVWGYLFRHSRATRLYEELPQQIVEKLLGHKNMAGVYAHISSKKAREEMLNKIYKIEELTPKEKDQIKKLEKQIGDITKRQEALKQDNKKMDEENKMFAHWIKIYVDSSLGKITEKEAILKMKALAKATNTKGF